MTKQEELNILSKKLSENHKKLIPKELNKSEQDDIWLNECNAMIEYYKENEIERAKLNDYEGAIRYRNYKFALEQLKISTKCQRLIGR